MDGGLERSGKLRPVDLLGPSASKPLMQNVLSFFQWPSRPCWACPHRCLQVLPDLIARDSCRKDVQAVRRACDVRVFTDEHPRVSLGRTHVTWELPPTQNLVDVLSWLLPL